MIQDLSQRRGRRPSENKICMATSSHSFVCRGKSNTGRTWPTDSVRRADYKRCVLIAQMPSAFVLGRSNRRHDKQSRLAQGSLGRTDGAAVARRGGAPCRLKLTGRASRMRGEHRRDALHSRPPFTLLAVSLPPSLNMSMDRRSYTPVQQYHHQSRPTLPPLATQVVPSGLPAAAPNSAYHHSAQTTHASCETLEFTMDRLHLTRIGFYSRVPYSTPESQSGT